MRHAMTDKRHVHVLNKAVPLTVDKLLETAHRGFHDLQRGWELGVEPSGQHADDRGRSELAALEAAHAVGHGEQRDVTHRGRRDLDEVAVLVGFAHLPHVGVARCLKYHALSFPRAAGPAERTGARCFAVLPYLIDLEHEIDVAHAHGIAVFQHHCHTRLQALAVYERAVTR